MGQRERLSAADLELFRTVPAAELAANSITRTYRTGELAFRQGEPTTGLWVVVAGRVALERIGPDGLVFTTGVFIPGEVVGLDGLWESTEYSASARALETPTSLLWMERKRFIDLHHSNPGFAQALCHMVSAHLRYFQETTADTRGRPVRRQVAVFLSTLQGRFGCDIALTHEELARMMGLRRETVTRVLHEFTLQGWI
ncbi:MAG: Crp/Fnr family transcriptional regulator, partial [Firmicutes bacterium]|nr:Crp/Fnr family transcriptional regulator [Bacillota bacterium]